MWEGGGQCGSGIGDVGGGGGGGRCEGSATSEEEAGKVGGDPQRGEGGEMGRGGCRGTELMDGLVWVRETRGARARGGGARARGGGCAGAHEAVFFVQVFCGDRFF